MDKKHISQSLAYSEKFFSSQLFHDVQMSGIFKDSKTFADAIARSDLSDILSAYAHANINNDEDLRQFVLTHFSLPVTPDCKQHQVNTVQEYIDALWQSLKREPDSPKADSLLPLPHPYIVPGGRFQEIYYWDTYFTAVGLLKAGKQEMVINMIDNFCALIAAIGRVPNGNRSYYHSRSQPPVLALLIDLIVEVIPHEERVGFISNRISYVAAEHAFWMTGKDELSKDRACLHRCVRLPNGDVLNRYWDDCATPRPESYREDMEATANMSHTEAEGFYRNIRAACESGWDFSSRWLEDAHDLSSIQTTHIIPVDLNCLLFTTEALLAKFYNICDEQEHAAKFQSLAKARQQAINTHLWDPSLAFYFDYDHVKETRTEIWSLAASTPLFAGCADSHQAQAVLQKIEQRFLTSGGLITTLTETEQQWDSPNGWAPLQWFAVQSCISYQRLDLANRIMSSWLNTVEDYFSKHHCLMEKYNVKDPDIVATGGEYLVQEGFGWTNGITAAFYQLIQQDALQSHNG